MRSSQMSKEFMVFELADFIGMDREELLNGKSLQLSVQTEIAKSLKNKKLAKAKDNLITVGKFARIGKLSSRNKNLEK